MPLGTPETTQSDTTWVLNGRLNPQSATSFQLKITIEGTPESETEADQLLQQLVDLLRPRYATVTATKGYTQYMTRAMTQS